MKFDYDANNLLDSTIHRTTRDASRFKPKRRNLWGWIFFWLPL